MSFKDTDAGRARPELADAMDKSKAVAALAGLTPRGEQELREENREQLQREVDASLEALREVYFAAACWMMIKEFIMQSDGPVTLVLEESQPARTDPSSIVARRKIVAEFPDAIGEEDVDNQLDNFVDDMRGAIAIENELRDVERRKRASSVVSEIDRG